MTSLTSRYQTP